MVNYLSRSCVSDEAGRDQEFDKLVAGIIFTWPWFYLDHLDDMLKWIEQVNLPDFTRHHGNMTAVLFCNFLKFNNINRSSLMLKVVSWLTFGTLQTYKIVS